MSKYDDKNITSYIDGFVIDGKLYDHSLFYRDDDRVECRGREGVVLTYTANCYAFDKDKKQIGRWSTNEFGQWYFKSESGKVYQTTFRDVLKAEVEVSKLYLMGELE